MKFTVYTPMIPPDHLLTVARAADESGWDGFAVPDSVFASHCGKPGDVGV